MLGLALEGGGVRGAFHMGAVKALLEEGYEFGGVTGTSIGALNGAVIAQGDFDEGYRLWESVDAPLLFDIEEEQYRKLIDRRIDKELLIKLAARMKAIIENKGIDTSILRQLIESAVNEKKLRESAVDFGLVTVSITDLKPLELYKEDIPEGRMVDFIMASSSYPGFKLNPIDDKYFIDGGFHDNCPINLLAKKGYKEIIAIRTLGFGLVKNVRYKDVKITNIVPSEDLGRTLDFNRDLIKRNLQMGYYDTMKCLKGLKGRRYYIWPEEESKLFQLLCTLPDKHVSALGQLLKIREMPTRRMLFEKVIPTLAYMMGMQPKDGYQDIIIILLELIAEEKGIERFRIYTLAEFVEEIGIHLRTQGKELKRRSRQKGSTSLNDKLNDALKKKHLLREAAIKVFEAITDTGITKV